MIKNKGGGGYDNYSLRAATLVEGYFPGPMRTNILMDPDNALGQYDPGTFGIDEFMDNGPGTIAQALPNASQYQTERIFEVPRGNPYREFSVDNRQIAGYQVQQLANNPLSIYATNLDAEIPKFECYNKPDSYSNMVNKRKSEYKDFFENFSFDQSWGLGGQNVYEQYDGLKTNPNAEIVYNLSLNSEEEVNPMISQGAPTIARSSPDFRGKCYSGTYTPYQTIGDSGGPNPPAMYNNYTIRERTQDDVGFMNKNNDGKVCIADRSLSFANPLILNYFN